MPRFISSVIFISFLIAATILVPTSRNFIIKQIAQYYLSSKTVKVKIGKLEAGFEHIHAQNASIYTSGEEFTNIENIFIDYDLRRILAFKKLNFTLRLQDKMTLIGKNAEFNAELKYNSDEPNNKTTQISISSLSGDVFSELGIGTLKGTCSINSDSENYNISYCKITDGKANVEIDAKIKNSNYGIEELITNGKVEELPIDLHKIFHGLTTSDATMQYLYNNISGAILHKGSWSIKLDKEYFSTGKMKPEYINGDFAIDNINLSYNKELPTFSKINTLLKMRGSLLDFNIISAYTNDTLLSNGHVIIDWGIKKDPDVTIEATAKGPASNLVNFIPKNQLDQLADSGLDLRMLEGNATSNVHLIVPIGDEPNSYNITSSVSKAALNAFDGAVILSKANLNAYFDGKTVSVKGKGLINGFTSNLDFTHYTDEIKDTEFENIIEIKSTLKPLRKGSPTMPYSIISGKAPFEFSYKDKKDGKAFISAKANLVNAEFGIDKLGIHSKIGDKAHFEAGGETSQDGTIPLNLRIIGKNDLQILGTAILAKGENKIILSKIRSGETDASAEIDIGNKSMKVKMKGKALDLSKSHMMQFLSKNADNTSTTLDISLKKVKMKGNVYLDDFSLNINCDPKRCYKGSMFSKVGTRDFTMNLKAKDDYEEWNIRTDNAGAIFKALGMMDNVKAGILNLNINTHRSDIKAGETIPIAKGHFDLEKFVTVDNKFLTRLVSFTSIPGLLNFMRNNSDISFTKMEGNFSYKNNELKIFDSYAEGPYMNLTIKGDIFTDRRQIKVKGKVSPSKYGPGIIAQIPIIGQVFKMTPYSIEHNY